MKLDKQIADLKNKYDHLNDQLMNSENLDNKQIIQINKDLSKLEPIISLSDTIKKLENEIEGYKEILENENEEELRSLAKQELPIYEKDLEQKNRELLIALLPKDEADDKNVILEIRGAEGGEEANLFARDLFEMYSSFASKRGWKLEVLNSQQSDMGGFTSITFILKGGDVWSQMKYEGGPHRVQRVPVTETQGRVHTSSATVSVLPEADEIDIQIEESDLQVDVFRSSGPGGQSVNTTDSAVRITHKPTGIIVSMQDEKSQLQNKARAMVVLRSRLLQAEQERVQAEQSASRKGQMGGGGRSEKIRTYNFKENRVTDHRIGLTLYKLDRILSGEINEVIDALAENERAIQLTSLEDNE